MAEGNKKIKVLTISDSPLFFSGCGIQHKMFCESLLNSGKFQIITLAGAIKHPNYTPIKTEQYGDDWTIFPVDNFGNHDIIRSMIRTQKPDIVWIMTDPRFWEWFFFIENEIRPLCPVVYYHVWDNEPTPFFNHKYYSSCDKIVTISKVTDKIVKEVTPEIECEYLPHSCEDDIFKRYSEQEVADFKSKFLPNENRFIFLWDNRNARRKQSGSLVFWFKTFLDKVGHDKACLVMHTDPRDDAGTDLEACIKRLELVNGEVKFSVQKMPPEHLALMYNMADCLINISDAEGFGMATQRALSCETPIIVTMTGGLQEQVTDGQNWFGIGIEPASKAVIGSLSVPYIYEDRISEKDFVDACEKMFNMSKEERQAMGKAGRQHMLDHYNHSRTMQRWVDLMLDVHARHGSWENRKLYKNFKAVEVK